MLEALDKIDVIATDPSGARDLAIVIEPEEWQLPNWKWLVQEKANNYAAFALDGEMHRKYPDSVGKKVSIVITPTEPRPADADEFFAKLIEALAPEIPVTIEPIHLPPEEAAA